ncbi:hypothetical protein P2318_33875 [Myxococcaceae bacterium GXIMD 01537]
MQRLQLGVVAFSAMMVSGCPSEFGKEGRIGKAVSKDTADLVISRCSDEEREEACGNGRQHTAACKKCSR